MLKRVIYVLGVFARMPLSFGDSVGSVDGSRVVHVVIDPVLLVTLPDGGIRRRMTKPR